MLEIMMESLFLLSVLCSCNDVCYEVFVFQIKLNFFFEVYQTEDLVLSLLTIIIDRS